VWWFFLNNRDFYAVGVGGEKLKNSCSTYLEEKTAANKI